MREEPRSGGKVALFAVLALLVVAFVTVALVADAVTNPVTDWDGRMTWGAHARFIHREESVNPSALRDGRWVVVHPQYPVLMPVLQVATWKMLGTVDERAPRALYALFLPALAAICYEAVRRTAGRTVASAVAALAALTPMLAFENHGGATGAYSDLPLGLFLGTGLLLLLEARRGASAGVAGGILLAAAVLTKNEGIPLAAFALLAAAGVAVAPGRFAHRAGTGFRRGRTWVALPVVLAAAGVFASWCLVRDWQRHIPNRIDEGYFSNLSVNGLLHGLSERIFQIAPLILKESTRTSAWGLLWLAVPVAFLLGYPALRRPRVFALALFSGGGIGLFVAAYAVTGWRLENIVETTWNRALVQLAVPLLCLVGALAGAASTVGAERRAPPPGTVPFRLRTLLSVAAVLLAVALAAR